ncbi:MAG TPA: hypothetical protein IAA62_04925 [Candidatus Caccopulliclostridium gallistercoris]|uniref:Uncharacterized protein n=1 Tax=Candidatus Caccopulliclostridium gallistercoris TaxID=2840719 RepID=A0A9D1NEW9_9FIRM|nr:hypothetical protein [Candidatus Caccopulliclostridium gallistercoris]
MNNLTSLLSFVDFGSALVNVLAIIAIIIAGGFIIFFLGDLLLSILDPKTEDKKKAKEERPEVLKEEKKVEEPKFVPIEEVKPEPVQEKEEEVKTVDEDLAEKERLELGYVEEPKDSFADLRAAEEEYKQNNLKALEEKQNAAKEEPADEDIDLNDFFFDDEDFNFGVQEDEEPEKVEEDKLDGQVSIFNEEAPASEEKVETVEENKVSEEAQAEIDELRRELEEQKAEYEALKEQTEKEKNKWQEERAALENLFETTENKEEFVPMMTLKEYEARLEVLKERLKANEKDLKANKKEFLPLARVKKNLDNDKKKLRRREALVAKQKVVLYGVNNYVDIDEEKAKKLAEDLDLLDGLRLSVQHCEEVIAANKERYPILETTNRILTTVNKEIKADIQEVETAIAKLKAEEDAGSKEEVKEEQPAVQETPAAQEETVAETPVEQAETVEEKKETTENNTEN